MSRFQISDLVPEQGQRDPAAIRLASRQRFREMHGLFDGCPRGSGGSNGSTTASHSAEVVERVGHDLWLQRHVLPRRARVHLLLPVLHALLRVLEKRSITLPEKMRHQRLLRVIQAMSR